MNASDNYELILPYFCEDLPWPLPTQEQIEHADEILADVGVRKLV
jgi:hypothetical protein